MNRSTLHEMTQQDLNAALIREGKLKAQLEAVRAVIVIKPHLEFPVGDRDCERVRVYSEVKAAIGEGE